MDTVVTLTFKEVQHILTLGGCPSWSSKNRKAKACTYIVCTRNNSTRRPFYNGQDFHGFGFLIGQICGIEPTPERSMPSQPNLVKEIDPTRINIRIDKFARIQVPELRQYVRAISGMAYRNPVHFVSMFDLPINPDALDWQIVPPRDQQAIDTYNQFHTRQRLDENRRRGKRISETEQCWFS